MSIVRRSLGKLKYRIQERYTKRSFSQGQQDIKLKPYLDFKRGFFIEAGAHDGITFSNTLYFEKYMKWRGLLIEPIPELAEQCKTNRPQSIVENCALVPFDYEHGDIEMRYCSLMSVVKGGRKSLEDELDHIRRGCEVQEIQSYELKVPARTLTSILDQHSIQNIDFLSLDVEGFELSALKGIDFDKYRPKFILIEANYRDELDSYLHPLYEPIEVVFHEDVLYKLTGV